MKVIKTKPRKAVVHVEVLGGSGQIPVGLHHRDHTRSHMASELAAAGVMIGHAASDWIRCAEEKIYSLCKIWSQSFQSTIIII